jgi:phage terminase large subunit-like protein
LATHSTDLSDSSRRRRPLDEEERPYVRIALRYARSVAEGKIIACKWVKLACERQLRDVDAECSDKGWPYRWDESEAAGICAFAEQLPHIEGKWDSPTIVLEPWQIFCLTTIFGWRRKSDGGRRFSKVYWEVARKNAKSTIAAVVSLYCLCCEGEPSPYVLVGATSGDQAGKVFDPARKMARATPELCDAFGLKTWAHSITASNGGYIKPINAKASTQDGHNPHLGVLDELHAHKDRALYDVIDSAFGARSNPLLWIITTAGFDVMGVCYEQRSFLTKVLEGVLEADHFWGIIYTIDEDDDAFDPAVWIKSNPNLDVSVRRPHLAAAAEEAKAQPGKQNEFLTKRQNVWCSAEHAHINMHVWRQCSGPVDLEALRGVPCWGGLDLASVSDLTSFRLIWLLDGRIKTWGLRYLPTAAVEPRTIRNSVPYQRWVRTEFMGRPLLTATEGNCTDYRVVERDIKWALTHFNIQGIGYDPWNAADLVQRLIDDGAPMIEVRQGFASLTGPMKECDRLYTEGLLDHAGDEVLTWCASNVVAKKDDADNIKPSKSKSNEKIDDYVALINALAVYINDENQPYSDGRGLLVI